MGGWLKKEWWVRLMNRQYLSAERSHSSTRKPRCTTSEFVTASVRCSDGDALSVCVSVLCSSLLDRRCHAL